MQVAVINEESCIGCVKCIKACPVDAIIGAARQMHTVIEQACTGCELCLPPCPVNCISLVQYNRYAKSQTVTEERQREDVNRARTRFIARNQRLEKEAREGQDENATTRKGFDRQAYITAAVERSRAKRTKRNHPGRNEPGSPKDS